MTLIQIAADACGISLRTAATILCVSVGVFGAVAYLWITGGSDLKEKRK